MKVGTKIVVTFMRPEGDVTELAIVARVTKQMLPLPAGYMPVRFQQGVLLVHLSRISAA